MTPEQVRIAIEETHRLTSSWLGGQRDRLGGKQFYHELLRLNSLTRINCKHKYEYINPDEPAPSVGAVPAFGGNSQYVLIYNDIKAAPLIASARNGDVDADAVLCEVAADFIYRGCVMPSNLRCRCGLGKAQD